MKTQATIIRVHQNDVEYFREALYALRHFANFTAKEYPTDNTRIDFHIISENAMFFYRLGEAFGTIKEFKSK